MSNTVLSITLFGVHKATFYIVSNAPAYNVFNGVRFGKQQFRLTVFIALPV